MEELIRQVSERTGISEEQAKGAVDTVLGYLKERMPGPLASQLDNAVGAGGEGGSASGVIGGLGGMFGGQS